MNNERLAHVRANLRRHGLSQMLLVDPLSIWWLCGYYTEPYERFLALYVPCDEAKEPVMFSNRLFPEVGDACADVRTFDDTEDPIALVRDVTDRAAALGVDKKLAARWLVPLMEAGAATGFALASDAIDDARSTKDAHERELMRAASAVNDQAMDWLAGQIRPGVTERQIADGLLGEYRRLGAQDHSFLPIVSFGDHGADPHHEPDDTVLKRGDVVLFDIGGRHRNYCSDMTRTFFWGEPDKETARIYDIVRRANEAAEALIVPGVRMCDLDRAARDVIEDAGYGQYFTHRLGHSIGLQDHEPGDVSLVNEQVVEPGMTFSIEPGIYLPGRTGVRIEDLALVTESGVEILNAYPHDPVRLD